ncbi:TonB-dependent receptor domain-containing protein [Melioribacteraceae bacterium 4301-Me]|uniref:TonB-dependent receptor n=1 Tax=Pyranulibacter aquaticus TaxID=3163344 RepID=UPI00359B1B65
MKILITQVLLLCSIVIYSQTGTITGRVIGTDGIPILGVNVILVNTHYGTATDSKGFFELKNVPLGKYTIQFSAIGYQKKIIENYDVKDINPPLKIVMQEQAIETPQIVVSATKFEQKKEDLTVSTSIIQPDFIARKNFTTFDDVLRYVSGVQMTLDQVSIRGSSGYSKGAGTRVLVAIDGVPLYSGDTGDIVWEMIPLTDIERVEVIKGPASSLYGSTAIGGVINIITKSSSKNPITQIMTYAGVYDKSKYDSWNWSNNYRTFYGFGFSHSNSVNKLGYTISLKKLENSGYRENDFSERYLSYAKLNFSIDSSNTFSFLINNLIMNRGNFLYWKDSRNALVPKDEDNGNTIRSNRWFLSLIYNHSLSKKSALQFKSSFYRTYFEGRGIEVTTSTANLFRNELIGNFRFTDSFIITVGGEFSYAHVKSNIFANPNFFNAGMYLQAEYKGIDKLIVTTGIRYDYIKLDTLSGASAVTPKFGLNYKLSKNIILRASMGTGFRAPTPAEVFTTAGVGGGVNVVQNPDLKSERSLSFEAGALIKYNSNLSFDMAFFQTDYENFIEPNLLKSGDIKFINLPKARIQGYELVTEWNVLPQILTLKASYNYLWARDLQLHKAMKYRPRNVLYVNFQYYPYPFDFGIDFRYWSKVEEIDNLLVEPPLALVVDGYKRVPVYVTDINIGYNFFISTIPAKVFLNIKNLFNYYYVEFIGNVAPLRNISLDLELFF